MKKRMNYLCADRIQNRSIVIYCNHCTLYRYRHEKSVNNILSRGIVEFSSERSINKIILVVMKIIESWPYNNSIYIWIQRLRLIEYYLFINVFEFNIDINGLMHKS